MPDYETLVSFLRSISYFQDLEDRRLGELEQRLEERVLGPGEFVFRQGEQADGLFLVREGGVEVFTEIRGEEKLLGRLGPGELFGEMAAFDGASRRASVRALGPAKVLRLPDPHVQTLLGASPRLDRLVRQLAARRHSQNSATFSTAEW